jgi:hypothetical protein
VGALPQGGTGIVAFTVTNAGPGLAAQVTARVTLPGGVTLLAAGTLGMASLDPASPGGWTCAPAARGATCTHGPLTAGASAASYLRVAVAGDAPTGTPPGISVDAGGRQVSARGTAGVSASGFPARFAASGRYAVVTAGATLLDGNAVREGDGCGTGSWDRRPAPQGSRAGRASATLTLPGPVVWAGLYWAWVGGATQAPIGLRGPGGAYQQVTGTVAGTAVRPGGEGLPDISVYQAFADVTALVARHGAGAWTATAWPGAAWPGAAWPGDGGAGYLGWTLVVVAADRAAPSGPVMVLDGVQPVDAADPGFSAPLGGLLTGPAARLHVLTWTEHGPRVAAFTVPLTGRPAVSFAAAAEPYLVGVIVATDSD